MAQEIPRKMIRMEVDVKLGVSRVDRVRRVVSR